MPYIKLEDRIVLDNLLEPLLDSIEKVPIGFINYIITKILLARKPEKYADYNELIGVIECIKQEFYRRAVVPYEDRKIKENSDVF